MADWQGDIMSKTWKIWFITIEHSPTKCRYKIPVLAESLLEAETKATDWPYSSYAFVVVKV